VNERLYLERLTERDLALLAGAAGGDRSVGQGVERLRSDPARIERLIGSSEVFDTLFAPWAEPAQPLTVAGPFLVFSVLLAGTARQLGARPFVREWIGPRERVPVFDVQPLRRVLDDPLRRMFLADLLASYTRVISGAVWVRDRRGWSKRRFSDLDPVRLISLLDVVPESERRVVYRRLGDIALFLSGVFPDFVSQRLFSPLQAERLERVLAATPGSTRVPEEAPGAIGLLERIGRSAYSVVLASTPPPRFDLARALEEVAERFADARRVLNVLTDTHLFPNRAEWFPLP
jgi:hypothetical protein